MLASAKPPSLVASQLCFVRSPSRWCASFVSRSGCQFTHTYLGEYIHLNHSHHGACEASSKIGKKSIRSAEADGYDMGYQTYGYEYGDQAVDAGNPCKKSLENERHGRDRPFERSEEREMIEFYAAILELRGIPVHCLLRAKMS